MAKKTQRSPRQGAAKRESSGQTTNRPAASARPPLHNWPLFGLSAAGMAIAAYLSYTGWVGTHAAFCESGGGCDIVQSSRWATFMGAPTAFWGLITYAALAFIALRVRRPSRQWQMAWVAGLIGWGVSVYLTAISVTVLKATCPYCLASFGIFSAILALLVWQRPPNLPRFAWPRWLLQTGAAALIVIAAMHFQARDTAAAGDEDPYLKGLAMQLSQSGALFYGASWCPHCQEQKRMFGASVERLPYIECSPNGPRAPSAPSCNAARVTSYPTWVFANGERVVSVLSLEELASRVGYASPPARGSD